MKRHINIFQYARVIRHRHKETPGLFQLMDDYCAILLEKYPGAIIAKRNGMGYPYIDVPLKRERMLTLPAAKTINLMMRQGDHIVFPKLTRSALNLEDFLCTAGLWLNRGIHVHLAQERLDLASDLGAYVLSILHSSMMMRLDYWHEDQKHPRRRSQYRRLIQRRNRLLRAMPPAPNGGGNRTSAPPAG